MFGRNSGALGKKPGNRANAKGSEQRLCTLEWFKFANQGISTHTTVASKDKDVCGGTFLSACHTIEREHLLLTWNKKKAVTSRELMTWYQVNTRQRKGLSIIYVRVGQTPARAKVISLP